MARKVLGKELLKAIIAAGILPKDAPVQRVVIDASWDAVLKIYVELVGTDQMIQIMTPAVLEGMQVEILA